jgi:hypothetical protein
MAAYRSAPLRSSAKPSAVYRSTDPEPVTETVSPPGARTRFSDSLKKFLPVCHRIEGVGRQYLRLLTAGGGEREVGHHARATSDSGDGDDARRGADGVRQRPCRANAGIIGHLVEFHNDDHGACRNGCSGAGTPATAACDRGEALAAVLASDAAEGGGHIDYLACLDGFGWALYSLSADMDTAHVLLSITTDGYQVLNVGTSLCPRDSGMPADVATAIAPTPAAANDCPEPAPTGGETVEEGEPAPDDEGHQPWREACVEDPTAYAGCQP